MLRVFIKFFLLVFLSTAAIASWNLVDTVLKRNASKDPPPLATEEILEEIKHYPKDEQSYWIGQFEAGFGLPPKAQSLSEYCAANHCMEFPSGYHSVQIKNQWHYIPLDWVMYHRPKYPKNPAWTEPRFYPGKNRYEFREDNGKITKRVSFNFNRAEIELIPFFRYYSSEYDSKYRAWGSLRSGARKSYTELPVATSIDTSNTEFLEKAGLQKYDEFFLLRSEGAGAWGFHTIVLESIDPVFQGRRVYVSCSTACSIWPMVQKNELAELYYVDRGGAPNSAGRGFVQRFKGHGEEAILAEMRAKGGYSMEEGGSERLIEYIEEVDELLEISKRPDSRFTQYD